MSTHKRCIRLNEDTVRLAIIDNLFLLAQRLELNLIYLWCFKTSFADFLEVLDAAVRAQIPRPKRKYMTNVLVGDANNFQFPLLLGVNEPFPGIEALRLVRERGVNKHVVYVVWKP